MTPRRPYFFVSLFCPMGERAKNKCATESRAARKAKKASEQLEASEGPAPPSDLDRDPGPTGTSNVIQPPTRST